MSPFHRPCPDCREPIARDAARCKCGWETSEAKSTRRSEGRPTHNMTCTWQSGSLRCHYPVGRFEAGMLSGWCIFHRATGEGRPAAVIAEDSQGCPPEVYLERAKALTYGDGSDNVSVRSLRAQLTSRATGGGVGMFAQRALGDGFHVEPAEPGSEG